jgi:hypothetical protein
MSRLTYMWIVMLRENEAYLMEDTLAVDLVDGARLLSPSFGTPDSSTQLRSSGKTGRSALQVTAFTGRILMRI